MFKRPQNENILGEHRNSQLLNKYNFKQVTLTYKNNSEVFPETKPQKTNTRWLVIPKDWTPSYSRRRPYPQLCTYYRSWIRSTVLLDFHSWQDLWLSYNNRITPLFIIMLRVVLSGAMKCSLLSTGRSVIELWISIIQQENGILWLYLHQFSREPKLVRAARFR